MGDPKKHPSDEDLGLVPVDQPPVASGPSDDDLGLVATKAPERPRLGAPLESEKMPLGEAIQTGQHNPFGWGDEAVGLGAWLHSLGHGDTPRALRRGIDSPVSKKTDYEVGRDEERANQDRALQDHPWGYSLGKASNEAIATAPLFGIGAAPTLGEQVGQSMLTSGATGAASAAGESRAATPEGVAHDTARGGNIGMMIGGAVPLVMRGIGYTGDKLKEFGDYLRGTAAGGSKMPSGEVAEYGRQVNEAGVPGFLPKSVHGYEKTAGEMAGQKGEQLGAMRQAATESGAGVSKNEALGALRQLEASFKAANTDTGDKQAKVVAREIERLTARAEAAPVDIERLKDSLTSQLAELAPESEAQRALSEGMPAALASRATPESQAQIRGAVESAGAGDLQSVPEHLRGPEWSRAAENPTVTPLDLAERSSKLRGPTEGGYPARGEARSVNTDTTEARKLAKRAAATVYSKLEDEAVNDPAHRAVKDQFGTLADIQNNAHAQGRPHALPTSTPELIHRAATNYGADTGAQAAYGVGKPLSAVGQAAPAGAAATALEMPGQARSIADKKAERSSDRAIDDPHYGSMISAAPAGEQRDVVYSQLLMSDPDFRSRERSRAAKLNEGGND